MRYGLLALILSVPFVGFVAGCDEKKADAPAAPAAAAPAAPAAPVAAPAAPAAPAVPVPAAAAAVPAAPATGDTCGQAYDEMTAMMDAMEKKMGKATKTEGKMPTKDKFVTACKALPTAFQSCMTMSYAMAHQKECADAKAKLDPATAAKVAAIMKGG